MNPIELKFLLKLLGVPDYRTSISKIKPNPKTTASKRNGICRELCEWGYLGYTEKVTNLTITPSGRTVLTLAPQKLPISETELKVLQATSKGIVTPSSISSVPAEQRQLAIGSLIERGFIKAVKTQIQEVWLTEHGKNYLQNEYRPSGDNALYSGKMIDNYIQFLRKSMAAIPPELSPQINSTTPTLTRKPSDEDLLQTIQELDRALGTKNYLPIFHVRAKLQPPFSRDELDEALYRLQRSARLQLGALQESAHYSDEQLAAGIQREFGGALFFISLI